MIWNKDMTAEQVKEWGRKHTYHWLWGIVPCTEGTQSLEAIRQGLQGVWTAVENTVRHYQSMYFLRRWWWWFWNIDDCVRKAMVLEYQQQLKKSEERSMQSRSQGSNPVDSVQLSGQNGGMLEQDFAGSAGVNRGDQQERIYRRWLSTYLVFNRKPWVVRSHIVVQEEEKKRSTDEVIESPPRLISSLALVYQRGRFSVAEARVETTQSILTRFKEGVFSFCQSSLVSLRQKSAALVRIFSPAQAEDKVSSEVICVKAEEQRRALATLGLLRDLGQSYTRLELQKAWRVFSLKHHPDKNASQMSLEMRGGLEAKQLLDLYLSEDEFMGYSEQQLEILTKIREDETANVFHDQFELHMRQIEIRAQKCLGVIQAEAWMVQMRGQRETIDSKILREHIQKVYDRLRAYQELAKKRYENWQQEFEALSVRIAGCQSQADKCIRWFQEKDAQVEQLEQTQAVQARELHQAQTSLHQKDEEIMLLRGGQAAQAKELQQTQGALQQTQAQLQQLTAAFLRSPELARLLEARQSPSVASEASNSAPAAAPGISVHGVFAGSATSNPVVTRSSTPT